MDRLYQMTVLVAVVEEGSFSGGARRLGMSPPAVTRAVALLEKNLGVKLLSRTTRFVRATDTGKRYVEHARRIIAEVDFADKDASVGNAEPRGHLTVTAPALFGRIFVMPVISEYLQRYKDMSVSTLFSNRIVNIVEEGVDVAVRIGELPDSNLRAMNVGHLNLMVFASPDYIKKYGVPKTPQDLAKHSIIARGGESTSFDWRFTSGNKNLCIKLSPRLKVSNDDDAINAALLGSGLSRLPSYKVTEHIDSGQLVAVLREFEPPTIPIHVVHCEGRNVSAKVRIFVDLLVNRLRKDPHCGYEFHQYMRRKIEVERINT